jgi:ATP-binding cassette subfamily C protein
MRTVLTIFFRAPGTRPWLVLMCLLFASIASGLGVAALLPVLSFGISQEGAKTSAVAEALGRFMALLGVEPSLLGLLALVVAAMMLKGGMYILAMRYVGIAQAHVATDVRLRLIRNLLGVNWQFFTTQPVGRFANAMGLDATRAGRAYQMAAVFFANLLQAIVYIGVALSISWKLALIALGMGLTIVGALHFLVRMAKKAGFRENQRTRELVIYLTDSLNNIKALKAMSRQHNFANLLHGKIRSLNRALRRQVISEEGRRSGEEMLIALALAVAFYLAVEVWSYRLSEMVVIGLLLLQVMRNVGKIQDNFQKAILIESPYRAVQQLLAETEAARESWAGTRVPTLERECSFAGVRFGHGAHLVFASLTLSIPARQITVITGASGGGKTTLIDLLVGLHLPQAGEVRIDGVPLSEIDIGAWRGMIGYVSQELVLLNDTIFANIALGDPARGEDDVRRALATAGALDFVTAMADGLYAQVGEKGAKLSGGQRQRVALARALIGAPKLLILDEVTSALDPETEHDLCQRIAALAAGMTIVAITHRPAFLQIADRAYRVDQGQVYPITPGHLLAAEAEP